MADFDEAYYELRSYHLSMFMTHGRQNVSAIASASYLLQRHFNKEFELEDHVITELIDIISESAKQYLEMNRQILDEQKNYVKQQEDK